MLDYIIVGQGIAGTIIGLELLKRGKKFIILDDEKKYSSSKVAAGIFNPVTGKRKAKTWQAEVLFYYLRDFYPRLETELGVKVYYPKPVYMLFDSIEEQNSWAGRISDQAYKNLLTINLNNEKYQKYINDPYGGIEALISGYVDVQLLLETAKKKFVEAHSFRLGTFDYRQLKVGPDSVEYLDIVADRLIFCEGSDLFQNPYFSWLPINRVKGELLTLEVDYIPDVIFNKNIFILPINSQKCLAGATYEWDDLGPETTSKAREELISKIDLLLKIPYKIVDQRAGIRPATKDRRPFLGVHPKHKNTFVFGGLGTKGVSIVPYYADHFLEFVENQKELDNDVNISRHYSLYFSDNNSI
jgi:glycine/D-amino acid oxidase-like deaminating enzyme